MPRERREFGGARGSFSLARRPVLASPGRRSVNWGRGEREEKRGNVWQDKGVMRWLPLGGVGWSAWNAV